MKINELIEELEAVRDRVGNIDVKIDSSMDSTISDNLRDVIVVSVCNDITGRPAGPFCGRVPDGLVVVL